MDTEFLRILEKIRAYPFKEGIGGLTIQELSESINVPVENITKHIKDEADLVERVLEFERNSFKVIFDVHNFEGVNAIDILLTVSKEMAVKFSNISPALTFDLKKYYPELYQEHLTKRQNFIFEKIKINLQKGISQGMYRDDLSIELISRLYIARLIDLHDPNFFPPEQFSFKVLFNVMFESFVRSIAKPEGLEYFEKKRKEFEL
jgi:AcrR family transcriptional regulator